MEEKKYNELDELDKEWLQLVKELMESNVTKKEFIQFLESKKNLQNSKNVSQLNVVKS